MNKYLLILFFLFSLNVFSQKQFNVLDWKADVMLNTWLVQQMHQQYDQRRQEIEKAVTSKKATETYIENVRKKTLRVIGDLPRKSALNPIITGTIQRDGYRVEKIIYESFPNHHVTANLYIPNGKGPFPAALLFCGHEDVSKATESYQKTAILFSKNGFVVFVIDPISQSERYQLTDENGKGLTRGGTTEHTLLNESSNLLGTSCAANELWDNVRGLDYLVTRSEIDTSRIGCLGNSGGGMQTIYFAAYDKRVKVLAPCSYLASRERTLELSGPADGCAQMPNEGKAQLELSDYLIAAAPKPLLILAGRYDFIDYTGTLAAKNDLKKIYASLGQPEKLQLFTYDDGHGISRPKREAAVSWFRKWFCKDPTPIKEGELSVLTDKELFCTTTGQVNTAFQNEMNIAARNLALFDSMQASREIFLQQNKNIVLDKIQELLSIQNLKNNIHLEEVGIIARDNIVFHKLILRKESAIPLPVLVTYPPGKIKKVIVWFNEAGKNKIADSASLINDYLQQQAAVVLADLRGMGETEDRAELNDPKYYNREYRNAMLALHIGRPLIGQRLIDVQTTLEFIEENEQLRNLQVEVNASGIAALPAIYAALLNDKIGHLNLYGLIRSFRNILENPAGKNWYSYVIPAVVKYYDLPDILQILGKARVTIVE